MLARALVAIGCNLGDRQAQLAAALDRLRATPGITLTKVSRWHETAPVGGPSGQGPFLDGALLLETSLDPETLRQALSRIELELGRERDVRWQARKLDLDLLLYDQVVLKTPELTIPHPRMAFRRFVLEPAAEIAADMLHPLIAWRIDRLLANLNGAPPYLAITGVPGVGKTRLAMALAAESQGTEFPETAILLPPELPGRCASGNSLEREMDFLGGLADLLRPEGFPRGGRFVVSDFWLDQTLAHARPWLDARQFDQFREAASLRRLACRSANLLVLLTTSSPAGENADQASLPFETAGLQNELSELALRPGVGPVLQLAADDPAQVFEEVRAAIGAMLYKVSNSSMPLEVLTTRAALRQRLAEVRANHKSIALVPTIGALHEGHLSLVDAARGQCDFTIVTIFVNPTQFGPGEDFGRYPRTLETDLALLEKRGVDCVFAPPTEEMYPPAATTLVDVPSVSQPLEGTFRPGHFRGVATIVLKLFNLVQPDVACFGRKDYQQSLLVRRMVEDLNVQIRILVCPTLREADGLAMSSRNRYLAPQERERALAISRSLRLAGELVCSGVRDSKPILERMQAELAAQQLAVDYVALADPDTLANVQRVERPTVALIAARVGQTRLIDNDQIG